MVDQDRFGGTVRLYGQALTEKLSRSHVLVVGIGGVGSWVAEALARTAVGQISMLDLDDICISNSNRQLPAHQGNMGRLKVEAMAERLLSINPGLQVQARADFLTVNNLDQHLACRPDFIIDAIDSMQPKLALIRYCRQHRIPLLVTGGAGGKTDPSRIRCTDLSLCEQDPLAAKLRSRLRKEFGYARAGKKMGVEVVWSNQPLVYPTADGQVCAQKPQQDSPRRLDCAQGFGASVMVTAGFGFAAVSRMIERMAAQSPVAKPTS